MYELIQHIKIDGTQASINFTSIPQIYTDLLIVASCRSTRSSGSDDGTTIVFNGATTNRSNRTLYGIGSGNGLTFSESVLRAGSIPNATSTANTFGNMSIYISNYKSPVSKLVSVDGVMENNASYASLLINAGIWNSTDPINSISLGSEVATLAAGSSATLYGINRTSAFGKPKAIGGNITYANGYWVHTFTGSGTFTPLADLQTEYLVVAGGGGGGAERAGGGGAGGYRAFISGELSGGGTATETGFSALANTPYSVVVGGGGAGNTSATGPGANGSSSMFSSIVAIGGGGGAGGGTNGYVGGSGGGAGMGYTGIVFTGGSGTANQGFAGGNSQPVSDNRGAGGGGGAGAAVSGSPNGGAGVSSSITGTLTARAGGGGAGDGTWDRSGWGPGTGAAGGGNGGGKTAGNVNGTSATANTGSGGGGGGMTNQSTPGTGGSGGSGIVIVRYRA